MEDLLLPLLCISVIKLLLYLKRNCQLKIRRRRRFKTRVINRCRKTKGFYVSYFKEMKQNDPEEFFKYTRMNVIIFDKLLKMVCSFLDTSRILPDSVEAEERLAITLQNITLLISRNFDENYFVEISARSFNCTLYHNNTVKVLWDVLNKKYLKPPVTQDEWQNIAKDFYEITNFPNCICALDGKHINIQCPAKSGSLYFNYKKSYSIVLLACCDANYLFKLVDIGAYGSESDGGVFKNSVFSGLLDRNDLNIPPPCKLPNADVIQPYVIVADQAFPLKSYIMRPYLGINLTPAQRIFNYRLSRARRIIENTFGILVNRWRLLRNIITAKVENVDGFVKAAVSLHNFISIENKNLKDLSYCPAGFFDTDERQGAWRQEIDPLKSVGRVSSNHSSQEVYFQRDNLKNYFVSDAGAVLWQNKTVSFGLYPDDYHNRYEIVVEGDEK